MTRSFYAFASLMAFALGVPASAGTLVTPALFASGTHQNVCVVLNIGTAPIKVTVEMLSLLDPPATETCTVQPNDLDSTCQEFSNDFAFCRVTASGSSGKLRKTLRAVMMNRDTNAPFEVFTAVEAR